MKLEEVENICVKAENETKEKRYDEAIILWKLVPIEFIKLYAKAQFRLGVIHRQKKQLDKTIYYLNQVPLKGEYYFKAQFLLGMALMEMGKTDKAIQYWEKVPKNELNFYENAQFLMGTYFLGESQFDKAADYLKKVTKFKSDIYARAQFNLGSAFSQQGYIDEAKNAWENIIESETEAYALAQLNLGVIEFDNMNLDNAIAYWSKVPITQMEPYSSAQWNLSRVYLKSDKFNDLVDALLKIDKRSNIYKTYTYYIELYLNISMCKSTHKHDFYLIYNEVEKILKHLYLSSDYESLVSHYTNISVSKLLLSKTENKFQSAFRLNTINLMNDPEEGLLMNKLFQLDSSIAMDDVTFISCFTLHYDCLNQYRLYSKEDQQEATGLSLVISMEYFATCLNVTKMINIGKDAALLKNESLINTQHMLSSLPLYRCIYFDPISGLIKVSARDEWSFHREYKTKDKEHILKENLEAEKLWAKYKLEILYIETEVSDGLKALSKYIIDIDKIKLKSDEKKLLTEILLPLRYLIKHMAFKEEQECRMVYVTQMDCELIKYDEKINRIYIDYEPSLMEHLETIYLAPKAKDEKMVFEYLCAKGQDVRGNKKPVRIKVSKNPFR